MREIRQSGLEGGVEFKPPSLPLFYRVGIHFGIKKVLNSRTYTVPVKMWVMTSLPQGEAEERAASRL